MPACLPATLVLMPALTLIPSHVHIVLTNMTELCDLCIGKSVCVRVVGLPWFLRRREAWLWYERLFGEAEGRVDRVFLPTSFSRPFLLLRFLGLQFHQLTSRWQPLLTKPQPSPIVSGWVAFTVKTLPYMTLWRFIRGVTITQTSGCHRICLTTSPISHLGIAPPLQGLIFSLFLFYFNIVNILSPSTSNLLLSWMWRHAHMYYKCVCTTLEGRRSQTHKRHLWNV